MKKLLLLLLVVFSMLTLAACKENENTGNNDDDQTILPGGDNNQDDDKEQTPPHTHSHGTTYRTDVTSHWYECSCGDKKDLQTHSLSINTETSKIECSVCGETYASTAGYENLASMGVNPEEANNAYQVLVYSFYDSDGDGYGDLKGLESKLDYIKDLGMNLIWLSPIMECESYHAYDITSFYRIDPKIGTMDDYLSLVNTAHEKDIKIMLDMPINHTSVNHEWFIEYLKGNNEYYQEKKPGVEYGKSSSMGDKATFYTDAMTGKTYFAAFGETMPDLNFQSTQLQKAIYDVFEYWVALGADGFRFDAVKHIYDPNEIPKNQSSVNLNWKFFKNLREHLKSISPDIYLLGENFSGQLEVLQYATAFDAEFDFESWHTALGAVTNADPWGGSNSRQYFDDTIVGCTNELISVNPEWIPTFMTGNHDVNRAASYIGDRYKTQEEKIAALKLYAAMVTLRSGIPFIYYGDEIGMYGTNKSGDGFIEDAQLRLPMNFQDSTIDLEKVFYSKAANGKTLGANLLTDWPAYKTGNPIVEEQIADTNSLYNAYKNLIAFRSTHPAIYKGTMAQVFDVKNKATVISFTYEDEVIYVAFNFSESAVKLSNISNGKLSMLATLNGATLSDSNSSIDLAARGVAVFQSTDGVKEPAHVPLGTVTVYFSAPADGFGDKAYCYAWTEGSSANASWPGVAMTFVKVNEHGQRIYSTTVDLDKYNMIIFSNGSTQSHDTSLDGVTNNTGFYFDGNPVDGKYNLGTYQYQ